MSGHLEHVRDVYDARWRESAAESFAIYPRNRLLASWTSGEDGHGLKMLDVGCGNGAICEHFASLGYDVAGIELSKGGIEVARNRVAGDFRQGNVEDPLPFNDHVFDLVFWGDNVEHLYTPMRTLGEIRRVLKPGGRLLVSCPNVGHWRSRLIYLLRGAMPRNEGHVNPPWEWEHIRFFTPAILGRFLEAGGFTIRRMEGVTNSSISLLSRRLPSLCATVLLVEALAPTKIRQPSL